MTYCPGIFIHCCWNIRLYAKDLAPLDLTLQQGISDAIIFPPAALTYAHEKTLNHLAGVDVAGDERGANVE